MVELQIVILAVAGSSPVGHPTFPALSKPAIAMSQRHLRASVFSGIPVEKCDAV